MAKNMHTMFRECLSAIPCRPIHFLTLLIVLFLLYFGFNTRFTYILSERPYPIHFDMLGRALLQGQLHLESEVAPERKKAQFPADPSLPYPFVMDAIIFDGKYYLQQEPFPGLVHAAWILVTGLSLHTGFAVVTASLGVLLFLALILGAIRDTWLPETPSWVYWFTVAAFAFSGMQLQMVSRPLIYHEAIAWGMLFVLMGAFFFFVAMKHERHARRLLALSGLAMGIATLCKLTFAVYSLSFAVCLAAFSRRETTNIARTPGKLVSFAAPVLFCVAILLGYNYARFGNPVDLGRSYLALPSSIAWEYCCQQANFVRLAHIPYNLYNYLVALPQITWVYHGKIPFLFWDYAALDNGRVFVERQQLGSILLFAPVLWLLFPTKAFRQLWRTLPPAFTILVGSCLCGSLLVFLFYTTYAFATSRFVYEFTPLLFVAIFCNLSALWTEIERKGTSIISKRLLLAMLLAANIILGFTLGFNGSFTGRGYTAVPEAHVHAIASHHDACFCHAHSQQRNQTASRFGRDESLPPVRSGQQLQPVMVSIRERSAVEGLPRRLRVPRDLSQFWGSGKWSCRTLFCMHCRDA